VTIQVTHQAEFGLWFDLKYNLVMKNTLIVLFSLHKKWIELWKDMTGMSDYSILWISFAKGIAVGLLIYHFFLTASE